MKAELITALRRCSYMTVADELNEDYCKPCAYYTEDSADVTCIDRMMIDAADALEEQQRQIEELKRNFSDVCNANGSLACERNELSNDVRELKAQLPKWISVEDKLPEESGEYIVYIQMGTGVEVPDFFGSNDLSYVTSIYFKKEQKLWIDEYDESYNADLSLIDTVNAYHVTHWMPLPQKPKGEQDED